jgi:hypothetical protein
LIVTDAAMEVKGPRITATAMMLGNTKAKLVIFSIFFIVFPPSK